MGGGDVEEGMVPGGGELEEREEDEIAEVEPGMG